MNRIFYRRGRIFYSNIIFNTFTTTFRIICIILTIPGEHSNWLIASQWLKNSFSARLYVNLLTKKQCECKCQFFYMPTCESRSCPPAAPVAFLTPGPNNSPGGAFNYSRPFIYNFNRECCSARKDPKKNHLLLNVSRETFSKLSVIFISDIRIIISRQPTT